jgi:hypothetical protein
MCGILILLLAVNPHLLAKRTKGGVYKTANFIKKEGLIKKANKVSTWL